MRTLTFGFCCLLTLNMLAACTDKSAHVNQDDWPTLEIVATHAIDTKSQITALTFVPNNVAPWLGRIILLDQDQHVFSTDIEGRSPLVITPKQYTDIAGIARENAAGIFFALTSEGKLEAFIQSDNAGNYMPISISGTAMDVKQFCKTPDQTSNSLTFLSKARHIINLEISVQNDVITLKQTASTKASKCDTLTFPKIEYQGKADGDLLILGTGVNQSENYVASIQNGLSIIGMEDVDYFNMTTANYGGGAFKDGVISLIDQSEKRIVFISLDYVRRQIEAKQNPQ